MTKGDKEKLVSMNIEFVNNPKISHTHSKLRTPLQTMVWKILQPTAQIPYAKLNPAS